MQLKNLYTRILSGIAFVVIMIGSILLSHLSYFAVFFFVMVVSLFEFYSLFKRKYYQPQFLSLFLSSVIVFLLSYFIASELIPTFCAALLILLLSMIFIVELFKKNKTPFQNIALTVLGIAYIALPISLLNFLVFSKEGFSVSYKPNLVLAMLILIWVYDSLAYVFGVSFGKHKLFPRISPKKSWEGFIGGFLSTLIVSFFLSKYIEVVDLKHWMVLTVIIIVFGTFGDLIESMLKRSIGVKDSGKIMPGHGGILDRFDSFFFVVPVVFTYLKFFELI